MKFNCCPFVLNSLTLRCWARCWSTCSSWWRSCARLRWRTWMMSSTGWTAPTGCWSSWWRCAWWRTVSETVFGEWTVMGSTIVLIHSYYNVWLRAQLGWQSFLLRRDAVNKIKSLPTASHQQLQQHNDICSICYQVCVCVCLWWMSRYIL